MKKNKLFTKDFYCCKITADHELFEIPTTLYPSLAKLKKAHKSWKDCGIVKITLLASVVLDGKY
jgi:hypothetical protein